MNQKILVPLDGSELADRILEQVRPVLALERTETVLLSVVPEIETRAAREHLERMKLGLKAKGISARVLVRWGDPAEGILRCARSLRPSLIAMATHGRSGPARWAMGSVAERVLRGTRQPVLLSNPAAVAGEIKFAKVLVPLDGSKLSARILPLVEEIGKFPGSEVVLLHVVAPGPGTVLGTPSPVPPRAEEGAVAGLEAARAALEAAGVRARTRLETGAPAERILAAAEEERADLIAMTTHGRSGIGRWVYGSVAEKVLRHGRRPLLLVRPPDLKPARGTARAVTKGMLAGAAAGSSVNAGFWSVGPAAAASR
ncbi:MAG: universal stress protein [Planctomycetales bacterium]|nr:universal stress protein [Planctomycetales bacterium]